MTKNCPRCGATFECRHNDIVHCQCAGISFTPKQREQLKRTYTDCLCRKCLLELAATP